MRRIVTPKIDDFDNSKKDATLTGDIHMTRMMTEHIKWNLAKFVVTVLAFIFLSIFCITLAGAAPPPPPVAPQALVLVICKVDDLTGQPGRHGVDPVTGKYDPSKAAKNWRDLELHLTKGLEYECRRDVLPLFDVVTFHWPKRLAAPLDADFSDWSQCGRIGVVITPSWQEKHKGWAVVGVGCPTPLGLDKDGDGMPDRYENGDYIILDWKLPGCPSHLPGTDSRMRCRFDASAV